MKILVISQYFWPEPFIINDLVKVIEHQGHQVEVLTGKPNYPDGKIYPGYQQKGLEQECYGGSITIDRVPLRPRGSATSLQLVCNYFSFVWSGIRHFPRLVRNSQFDVILVFAPSPITSAIPAMVLKWLKKKHLAIWVQDLWPESLAATGHIKNSLLLKTVTGLVRLIYRSADTLLIQSHAFYDPVARLAKAEKIVYYPNSTLPSTPEHYEERPPQRLIELLDSKFCVVFAGNIGKAQAVETIVAVAKLLADKQDIVFVLVGSGSMAGWVEEQKNVYPLHNLVLAGRYPMQIMPKIFEKASALLVTLRNEEIMSYTVPSKVQAYLAAGKPVVAALNGEGARIINEAEAGFTCRAEDAEGLAASILQLYETTPEARARMGSNGYRYFKEHFEMNKQAENLINILKTRITIKELV